MTLLATRNDLWMKLDDDFRARILATSRLKHGVKRRCRGTTKADRRIAGRLIDNQNAPLAPRRIETKLNLAEERSVVIFRNTKFPKTGHPCPGARDPIIVVVIGRPQDQRLK